MYTLTRGCMCVYKFQCTYFDVCVFQATCTVNLLECACVFTGHPSLRRRGCCPGPCGCASCPHCRSSRWACGWTRDASGCRPAGWAEAPAPRWSCWSLGVRRSATWKPCRSRQKAVPSCGEKKKKWEAEERKGDTRTGLSAQISALDFATRTYQTSAYCIELDFQWITMR